MRWKRSCVLLNKIWKSMKKRNTKKTITGWSLQVTWSDGREETITDIDNETVRAVDTCLSELEQERDANKK